MKLIALKLFVLTVATFGFVACGKKDGGGGQPYGTYINGQCMMNNQIVDPSFCNGIGYGYNNGYTINGQGICVNAQGQPAPSPSYCQPNNSGYYGSNIYENNAYWGSHPYGYHPWVGTPGYFGGYGAGVYAGYCYNIFGFVKCKEF